MWLNRKRTSSSLSGVYLIVSLMIFLCATQANARVTSKIITLRKSRPGYYSIKVQYPRFIGVSAVQRKANSDLARDAKNLYKGSVRETLSSLGPDRPDSVFESASVPSISLSRPDLISVSYTNTSFTGGAHPNMGYDSVNFGLVDGIAKRLSLSDLFKPGVNARKVAGLQVYNRLKANPDALWIKQGTITASSGELTSTFVITCTGLTFLISPYDVGPYSSGSFTVKVPWKAFGTNLNRNGPLKALLQAR